MLVLLAFMCYMWSFVAAWAGAGAAGLPGLDVEYCGCMQVLMPLIFQGYTSSFMGAWAGADRPGLHVEFHGCMGRC